MFVKALPQHMCNNQAMQYMTNMKALNIFPSSSNPKLVDDYGWINQKP